jgi:hypothetical protein
MAGAEFRVPGFNQQISSPASFVTGVLRAFDSASQALGVATDRLVLRLARSDGGDPDYQIQTLDGEDIAAFSGSTHDFLFDDITTPIESDRLSREEFAVEDVKDWLNQINGEGRPGGTLNAPLRDDWLERNADDARDDD